MGLSKITAEGVEKAITEFDELGREAFLEKYGFGKAEKFFLARDGKRYDSKAIAGVSHGYSGEQRQPLKHDEFSGGKNTVVSRLVALGFEVTGAPNSPQHTRNPSWSRDELIVTLDFYFQYAPNIPGTNTSEIKKLSEFLNQLWGEVGGVRNQTFRNPNAVYMKLMNFHRFDPEYPGKGLERGGKADRDVWNRFSSNREELSAVVGNIRHASRASIPLEHGFVDGEEEADEGRLLTRLHRYRERDPKLVQKKKDQVLEDSGVLVCEVCLFDFSESYGDRGEGYIECHHKTPVSELAPDEKTKLSDLALLCANCHRMIHRRRPWPTVSGLKKVWDAAHPREP